MFKLPFFGGGGLPASPAGGPAVAPQGGMFNAWPTMLTGPQGNTLSPPSVSGAAQTALGYGGPIAALQFLLSSGGRSKAVVDAIRANAAKAGLPDPFTTATPMAGSNLGSALAAAGNNPMADMASPAAPAQAQGSDAIPMNNVPAYGSTPMPMQPQQASGGMDPSAFAQGVPMPRPRPMPQASPAQGFPGYYNGPGSMSFGAGDGPSGSNTMGPGILAALFGGR